MLKFTGLVTGLSRILDKIAGLCMVLSMLLVVVNILLRALFNRPILGVYEYVIFLTLATIGLSLAHCAIQNGHIAVSFVFDRLPLKIQGLVDLVINAAGLLFWGLCAWQVGIYAHGTAASGVVASTTQIPLYPFIYLVAFGLLALGLVLLAKTMEAGQRVWQPKAANLSPGVKTVQSMQKAAALNK
ncbi:TRAP transporter small permease [Desulfallas thermosapovorans]|uniref:TRAP-type C4-dicarboxylate transport system permease small subunit n=1 Tax=Desulfallas thermosapovorans DSM 6562 TaxID=1121431 RepID=A0A5S4ZVK0_9FIRM|nr:TRAP transporter small permease [Desulfallas thermosapovorans]TYO97024.1 TRAP-type C4-dicarboxylate transport system permease small subunit [Desulfallas thermosapovorans DSM 6562]